MDTWPILAGNYHGSFLNFAEATGAVAGLSMRITGHGNARLAVDLIRVSDIDHVIYIGCGPGCSIREAAHHNDFLTGGE